MVCAGTPTQTNVSKARVLVSPGAQPSHDHVRVCDHATSTSYPTVVPQTFAGGSVPR